MKKEIWRPVKDFNGWYEVSNLGRVMRVRPGKATHCGLILKPSTSNRGRLRVTLTKNGQSKTMEVAMIVASSFLPPRPNGLQINHIDYNCKNNESTNLEFVTPSENILHAYKHGFVGGVGERQHLAKLKSKDISLIRKSPLGSSALAMHYGVSRATIKAVRAHRTWKHIR